MKRKIFIVTATVVSVFILAAVFGVFHPRNTVYNPLLGFCIKRDGIWLYDEDFTAKYKETLDVMFSGKWTIKSKTEKNVTPEEVCAHVDSTPYQFTQWEIQYYDGNGKQQIFVLNNMDALSDQIQTYLENYVATYYESHFYKKYLKDVPLAAWSFIYCFWDDCHANVDRHRIFDKETKRFLLNTETPDGAICFSELTSANVFEKCPMYLAISIDGEINDTAKKQISAMWKAMNAFTNGNINAQVSVNDKQEYYIKGKAVEMPQEYDDFEEIVYESYKGTFW